MKNSHVKTPRTLNECHFTPGYQSLTNREPLWERIAGYALALAIGTGMAALLVAWWSS
ncbi:MAG: hypothetical protein RL758_93 [Pseudomonadota bacterium]|jgi:hypothetical protein